MSRFADFGRLYSHVAVGSCSRQGVLELREDQGWTVYWCVLDDSTHSFSYYSVQDSGPPATRDTLLLRALSGVAVIPFNTACDAHAHELQQTLAAQSAPPRLRPFQFRLEVGEKVGVCIGFDAQRIGCIPTRIHTQSYVFACPHRLDRDEWIESLLMAIVHAQKRTAERLSRCARSPPVAEAMWAVDGSGQLWCCREDEIGGCLLAWNPVCHVVMLCRAYSADCFPYAPRVLGSGARALHQAQHCAGRCTVVPCRRGPVLRMRTPTCGSAL